MEVVSMMMQNHVQQKYKVRRAIIICPLEHIGYYFKWNKKEGKTHFSIVWE